jgi:hypothetical protein
MRIQLYKQAIVKRKEHEKMYEKRVLILDS